MNPSSAGDPLPPPPQPPQPHRTSTTCHRHPAESFTSFCPSCLSERLSLLDNRSSAAASGDRKSTSAALQSIFTSSSSAGEAAFRRTRSFSGRNNDGFLGFYEPEPQPQRKSCDVRARNTLTLFGQENEINPKCSNQSDLGLQSSSFKRIADSIVIESKEQEEYRGIEEIYREVENGDEIEGVEEGNFAIRVHNRNPRLESTEELGKFLEEKGDLKAMKHQIDLDSQNKKIGTKDLKELAGSFWSAASIFSKKLRSWTKKNKNNMLEKQNGVQTLQGSRKKSKFSSKFRDTQSEIADYGYGRRSCDTDPRLSLDAGRFSVDAGRFSIDGGRFPIDAGRFSVDVGRFSVDAGRMSIDDPRCSFEEPRASWDGYLIGRSLPRMMPQMGSVVEDAPEVVSKKDTRILFEEQPRRSSVSMNDEENMPGGVAQTKDYYSDSFSRRRKSLDRSSSIKKMAAAVVAEMEEMKSKVSPTSVHYFHGSKALAGDRDSKDSNSNSNSNSNSLRDDCSNRSDIGLKDNGSVPGIGERKDLKKPKKWRAWNLWGLMYRRGSVKDEERDSFKDERANLNRNVFQSNSSVSWRNSYNFGGETSGSLRKSTIETHGHGCKKTDDFLLERNRGMSYLTSMRGSRRGVLGRPKPPSSHSIARSAVRLY